ncbi:MAG: 6-bladed beta-propeller [Acidobacteriota bacterium]|nr:6-bladed beta-propeller [Acidobacteriota bacterium]
MPRQKAEGRRPNALGRFRQALVLVTLGIAGATLAAQGAVSEIAFDTNADLLRTPADVYVGEVGGVGANSKGQIFVYTRTGHPSGTIGDNRTFYRNGSKLFQFDANGTFVRELGQDVYGFNAAIGLRVDPQDNVWTIDEGANQVVKFDAEGRVALVLGRKPEAINVRPRAAGPGGGGGGGGFGGGAANRRPGEGIPGSSFNRPTDVAWDKAGNIYVADGIGSNNRVAKFDKDGRFLKHWGSTGSEPGQFQGVKALAIDAADNVYAADTGNKRIQVFDADGAFKSQFGNIGTPLAMCISPGATQYLYVSHSGDPDGMEDAAIYKVRLDGTVVGKFGAAGKRPKEFGLANSLDCRSESELLVGEMTNWRVQKVTLKSR